MTPLLFALLSIFSQCDSSNFISPDKITATWQPGDTLLPIEYHDRWGFINPKGQVLIAPKFRDIGTFSEGLCPARLDGAYGFINTAGEFALPPQYDYATSFSEGLARVYRNGQVGFIDRSGKEPWPIEVFDASSFKDGLAEVTFKNGDSTWTGVLDKNGRIRIPQPEETWASSEGRTIATREIVSPDGYPDYEYAVLDSASGRTLVPFGKYTSIEPFKNGYAEVWFSKNVSANTQAEDVAGFINRNGQLVFTLPNGSYVFDNYFSEGLIAITTGPSQKTGAYSYSSSDNYISWYDTTGKIQMVKREDETALPFQQGRSFSGKIRHWYLMDRSGKQLGNNHFEWIQDRDFSQNLVLVAAHPNPGQRYSSYDKWGAIDSMGNYVIQPQFDKILDIGFQSEGLWVALADPKTRKKHEDPYTGKSYRWGLIDRQGNYRIEPKFTQVSESGFQHGLLYAELDSLYGYIDTTGRFVWSAVREKADGPLEALNTTFMQRGYLYGYPAKGDYLDWYPVNHSGRAIAISPKQALPSGKLGIAVYPELVDTFQQYWKGITALVFNTSSDTVEVETQDNRLYILLQALDASGKWRDIEYSPNSWCGNSYYSVHLAPNQHWKFIVPVYEGEFPTTLRLAFTWKKAAYNGSTETQILYSNTFRGSINLGQFWNKSGHRPGGLMDPYNE